MKRSILILSFFLFTTLLIGQNSNSKPLTIGTIEEIQSEILNEKRTLNIYLPTYFDENKKYPVIYVLDGGLDEEFIHIAGLVQFYNLPWVAMVEESIVVGIENVDRRRDFTFPTTVAIDKKASPTSGHSDKFIAYLEKEVQPFIESKFKTTDSKTIIGQSLAGLLAAEVLIKKPTLFDKYIIVSAISASTVPCGNLISSKTVKPSVILWAIVKAVIVLIIFTKPVIQKSKPNINKI